MKLKILPLAFLILLGMTSCRDNKKEAAETEEAVETIDSLEAEMEADSKQLKQDEMELNEALKELDSI